MHKTFCVLPWYSKEISKIVSPCCLLNPGYKLDQVKQDLLAGIQSPSCSRCWEIESNGQQSRRQRENIFLDFKLDRDIDKIQQDCEQGLASTLLYQITTSNLCNQACVSCRSELSSKWAELDRKAGVIPAKTFSINVDLVGIDYQNAQRIELLGGEPLFDPNTFVILEKLLEHNNTSCTVSLVTNGSISLTAKQKEIFSKFENLNICVSIDGIGPVFEYMRWPTKWSTLTENILEYKSLAKNVSVSYTISSLNALYYDETVEWFAANNLRYSHNMVINPRWLSLHFAPIEIKKQLQKQHNFVADFVRVDGQEISLEVYCKKLQAQDTVKKIQLQNYLPEVGKLINLI